MFRRDKNYMQVDSELAGRAFSCLYALHQYVLKKEVAAKKKKEKSK